MAKLNFLFCFVLFIPQRILGGILEVPEHRAHADTVQSHSALTFGCTRGWSLLGMSFCVPCREAEPRVKFSPDIGEDGVSEGNKPQFPLFVVRGSGLIITQEGRAASCWEGAEDNSSPWWCL